MIEAALGGQPFPATGYFEDDVYNKAIELTSRRVAGEPLQYLTGITGFRRLELAVGPGVLVPRPETEMLVEYALRRLPADGTVVDVGTGSGAIALAIADERPDAHVIGTDVSSDAIEWAARNKERLGSPAEFLAGDLFDPLQDSLRGQIDLVVSNPPYIADRERNVLPTDVVDHEPHVALFAGADGLSVIERLAVQAFDWLRPGGWLLIEISPHLQTAVPEVLERHEYEHVAVHPDLAERPRVVEGRRP